MLEIDFHDKIITVFVSHLTRLFLCSFFILAFCDTGRDSEKDENLEFLLDQPYNIIPLGSDCRLAMHLKSHQLRYATFPLDWIRIHNIATLYDLLLSDFEDFVNFSYLRMGVSNEGKDYCVRHGKYDMELPHLLKDSIWMNTKFGLRPKDKDQYKLMDEITVRYKRRINRLYEVIEKSKLVYFVRLDIKEDEAIVLYEILREKFPQSNFKLVCIMEHIGYKWKEHENIICIEIFPGYSLWLTSQLKVHPAMTKGFRSLGWID